MHAIVEWVQKLEMLLRKRGKYQLLLTDQKKLSELEMFNIFIRQSWAFCLKTKCDSITDICEIENIYRPLRHVLIIKFKLWHAERFIIAFVATMSTCFRRTCDLAFFFWGNKTISFLKKINNLSCARTNRSKTLQKWSSLALNLQNLRLLSSDSHSC